MDLDFLKLNKARLIHEEMNLDQPYDPNETTNFGTVYLIHFDKPYKHAKHYLGFSTNLRYRMIYHRKGLGANLLKHANLAGIGYNLVRTWYGTRNHERRLKNYKNAPELCPICKLIDKNQTKFFCNYCQHNHYLNSKAGKGHYRYAYEANSRRTSPSTKVGR